jgi:hypothetical protein
MDVFPGLLRLPPPMRLEAARWEFTVPGLEGREIREVLELVYKGFEEEVLPTAEQLMVRAF